MLEVTRHPACVLPCHTLLKDPARRSMSDRKYSGSTRDAAKTDRRDRDTTQTMRDHRHARSSAEDPTISSTRSSKHVSSNSRNHPRAELRDSGSSHQSSRQTQGSPVLNHVSSKTNGGRKRACEDEEEEGEVWVEHTSSSGRVYYYNKKNGVSQWESPKNMAKRTKTEDAPSKHMSHSTPLTSKLSAHPHSSSSSHLYSSHSHSHVNKESSHRSYSSSHHASHSSHHTTHSSHHHDRLRERERGHGSHRRSNRGSRSSSKSTSVSPTLPRGRGHHENKTTPTRHSRSYGGKWSVSPNVPTATTTTTTTSSSSKPPSSSASAVAVSPCTPNIPHGISQSLVATQQYINHTSAILKHQQKLLSASGDPVTPVMHSLSPPTTKYTAHPHARQKLMFNPSCPANGPLSQDSVVAGNLVVSEMSPQMAGMESLHPLQRALLLQQQQQQQQAALPYITAGQSIPGTPLPSAGATPHPQGATPPISALPPHLVAPASYPGSPFSDSPSYTPPIGTPTGVHLVTPVHPVPGPYTPQGLPPQSQTPVYAYSMPMMVPAPTPIAGIYMTDSGIMTTAVGGMHYMTPPTPTMQPPMSRLGRRSSTDELSVFPDPSQVESVASRVNLDLFSQSLAESWWSPSTESLHRQLDASHREILSRRTTEALYLQGRLRRAQLSLDCSRVRSNTRRERLLAVDQLMGEILQR